ALLGGCAVGPDYSQSETMQLQTRQPDAFHAAQSSGDATEANEVFWQGFEDPVLERLIATALTDNLSLQAMLARYKSAHALLRHARLDQVPSVTAFAGASDQKLADVERAPGQGEDLELYQA